MSPRMNEGLPLYPSAAGFRYDLLPLSRGTDFIARYNGLALVAVLFLVYLHIANYTNALNKGFPPKYFYALFTLLLLPLLLRFKTWVSFLVSPFALWALAVISINMVYLVSDLATGSRIQAELADIRIKMLLFALVLGMAFSNVRTARFEWIFPVLAALLPLLILIDFLMPGFFYPLDIEGSVRGRSAATFINPTTAGEGMLVLFLLACQVLRPAMRTALLLVVGAGVFLTFSRSSILAWFVLWFVLAVMRVLPRSALTLLLVVMGVAPLLLGGLRVYLDTRTEFTSAMVDLQQRLDFFASGDITDGSATERSLVLKVGWETFLNNIVVGTGPGVTQLTPNPAGSVGIHNQFVMLAAEYGLFGIGVWIALACILWKGQYFREKALQQGMFILFILMTPFTHNMFDFPFWLLTFALASGKRRV